MSENASACTTETEFLLKFAMPFGKRTTQQGRNVTFPRAVNPIFVLVEQLWLVPVFWVPGT